MKMILVVFLAVLQLINGQLSTQSCLVFPCLNGGQCQFDLQSNQPICVCQQPFIGRFCEINSLSQTDVARPSWLTPETQEFKDGSTVNNLCLFLPNACKNGGQCYSVGPAGVRCHCPILYTGAFCETLAYVPCPNEFVLCSRLHGDCKTGTCVCEKGWNGPRCDDEQQCADGYCLNGGTCKKLSVQPYLSCTCPDGFTGDFCEKTAPKKVSVRPCDYTIRLLNTGLFTARFTLFYYYDEIRQPLYSSNPILFIGNTVQHTIKGNAKQLKVYLEVFGLGGWKTVHVDTSLGIDTDCIKCYKLWGTLFNEKWDHILC